MNHMSSIRADDILIVVDIQNDFCHGGNLAIPAADEVLSVVNRIASLFPHVILTQDWHPKNHFSFASSHPGALPYQNIQASYGAQTLWPDHCIQDTHGAEFHPELTVLGAELILRKGYHSEIDSYSAFYENDHRTPTGLSGYLRQRGFARVFLAGLAFDYCVRFSAEDARRDGFDVIVIEDACRSIAEMSGWAARRSLSEIGAILLIADELRKC